MRSDIFILSPARKVKVSETRQEESNTVKSQSLLIFLNIERFWAWGLMSKTER